LKFAISCTITWYRRIWQVSGHFILTWHKCL